MPNEQNGTEKRSLKRWYLMFYLRVFDQDSGALLGHVVDISKDGMMLISDQPIPIDQEFRLWVDVPQDEGGHEKVFLLAHSRWSGKDVNPDFYATGFRLIDPTPEALFRIQVVIDDFRFHR